MTGSQPAAAHDANVRSPPPRERPGAAVAVAMSEGRGGQLGSEQRTQLPGQHPVGARGEVIQRAAGGQQGKHPIGQLGRHAAITRRGYYLGAVAASVQQADHPGRAGHSGERHGAARIDADLQGVAIPPDGKQTRFERWPHAASVAGRADNSGNASTLGVCANIVGDQDRLATWRVRRLVSGCAVSTRSGLRGGWRRPSVHSSF